MTMLSNDYNINEDQDNLPPVRPIDYITADICTDRCM